MRVTAAGRNIREIVADLADRDWQLALALAFFVAIVVWFGRSVKDFVAPRAADILVPAFSGQTQVDALAECERLKIVCAVIAHQPSDRFPRDVVISQQPDAGSRVREGRALSLVVSTGVQIFPMPDLRYESLRNASLTLARLKLDLARTSVVANDQVPANHVLLQDPPPLSSVRVGSSVSLILSKGPPNALVLPNFVDLTIDAARDRAALARVSLGQVVWTPFGPGGPPRGTVVRQSPAAGRTTDPFEPVSLQVSAGPTEYGYLVRQVHATVAIPMRDDAAHVRMEVRDETGTWNVYDSYAQSGQKIDLMVTAVGTAEIDTYVNEELLNATKVGVEPPRGSAPPRERPR